MHTHALCVHAHTWRNDRRAPSEHARACTCDMLSSSRSMIVHVSCVHEGCMSRRWTQRAARLPASATARFLSKAPSMHVSTLVQAGAAATRAHGCSSHHTRERRARSLLRSICMLRCHVREGWKPASHAARAITLLCASFWRCCLGCAHRNACDAM